MGEREIAELIQERDERGAAEFITHYGPLIRYIAAPILQNPHDEEECFSQVVMRVWENIGKYDSTRGSLKAWCTAIARNTALNMRRKACRDDTCELSADIPSEKPGPEETALQNERRVSLNRAIMQLKPKERIIFYRKYYYMQKSAQIAAEMGMTVRGVEGKLYRIKKRLREALGGGKNE